MQTRIATVAVLFLCFLDAKADFVLSNYAMAAANADSVNKLYGIQAIGNPASKTELSVGGGSVLFKATLASDMTDPTNNGYTANVGLLHPITPDWAETDLTGLTGITFEYKNSAKITDALVVSFGSGSYSAEVAKAGTVYESEIKGSAALAPHTTWATALLSVADFATPVWWTTPAGFPSLNEVLTKVKNLQFAPKSAYTLAGMQYGKACAGKCVGPDMSAITMEFRNVTLKGVDGGAAWPNPTSQGCETGKAFTLLDDFVDGNPKSKLGGYWYVLTDSGSAAKPVDIGDKAKGTSSAAMTFTGGDASTSGFAMVNARLNKKLGSEWHDYAGWAGIGIGFEGDGFAAGMENLKAISFQIRAVEVGPNVQNINFKVAQQGVSDTAAHIASMPVSAMALDGGKNACIRLEDLKQPSYVVASQRTALTPNLIKKLSWEAKITDNRNRAIDTATAKFWITDVKLYGSDTIHSGVRSRRSDATGLSVHAGPGGLNLSGYQGVSRFEVRTLEGKVVARFAPAATVPLSLVRGSYLLVGERDHGRMVRSFAVF